MKIRLASLFVLAVILHAAPGLSEPQPVRSMKIGKFPQRTVEKFQSADYAPQAAANGVRALAACADKVYAGTDKGVSVWHSGAWSQISDPQSALASGVTALACNGGLAIGTNTGTFLYSEKGLARIEGVAVPVTALDANGNKLAIGTTSGLYLASGATAQRVLSLEKKHINDVAFDPDGALWAGLDTALAMIPSQDAAPVFYVKDEHGNGPIHANVRSLYIDAAGMLWMGTPAGLSRFDRKSRWDHIDGKNNGLPYEDILTVSGRGFIAEVRKNPKFQPYEVTGANPGGPNQLWVGTSIGAALYDGYEWHYFQGPQYLHDDRVQALASAQDGTAWLGTPAGLSHVVYKMMTLKEKAEFFTRYTQEQHNRYGMFSGCHLEREADPNSCKPTTSDNDGLWTAMYVAAECYRYGATKDPEAKRRARQALESIMFLETVNEIPGFVSRSFAKPDDPHCDGEWDHITSDGKWRWKGDTSSDEIDGHMYVYSVYYDVCADEQEKKEIREKTGLIMGYIVDHDFYLIDTDGKPTTWGKWNPEVFKTDGPFLKGLNSLEILSYLMTAEHITGDPKFSEAYRYLVKEHGYAKNTVMQKLSHLQIWNHSDDELAFLAYYPLMKYEKRPFLLDYYNRSLERSWQIERTENNPLFNFIYGAAMPGAFDVEQSVWMLQRIPLTGIRFPHRNTHRADIVVDQSKGRFNELQSVDMLPMDERTLHIWNENPFRMDGREQSAYTQQPGTWFLLPYWMGRYYGFIVEQE
jgi:hypothetical protein